MKRPSAPLVISLVALFFSLTGAGLAASGYLITSTSQVKPSVLAKIESAAHASQGPNGQKGDRGTERRCRGDGSYGSARRSGIAGRGWGGLWLLRDRRKRRVLRSAQFKPDDWR